MGSLLRATNLWGYGDLVAGLGGDPEALLARFRIPVGIEDVQDSFVSCAAFVHLLEATAAELGCPDLGLRMSHGQGLDILGPIAVIARNEDTVGSAFASIARYLYVHSPALRMTPAAYDEEHPDRTRFLFEIVEPGLGEARQSYELSLANGARILRLLGGGEGSASVVAFRHPRLGPEAAYAEAFGCEVRFGQDWCGMELPPELVGRVIDNADPETRRVATRYLESHYVPDSVELRVRVADLVRRLLPTSHCSAQAVAEQLGLHPRTLQRRLAQEGVTFAEILDGERRELARRLLAQPGLGLGQIAGLLGYAEQSTFNRSARRWFGESPGRFRAERVAGASL